MKNKVILFLVFLGAVLSTSVMAQQQPLDFSVKVYGSYGLLAPNGDFFNDFTSNATGAFTKIKYGLGNGAHAGAGLSLKLNAAISVGIDADYLTGNKSAPNNTSGDTSLATFKSHHSVFSLIPNISVKLCSHTGYDIYNTIGIITALKTNVEFDNYTSSGPGNLSKYTGTDFDIYKYGLKFGLQDAFGVQFRVSKKIMAFGQVTGYYLPADPVSYTETATLNSNGPGSILVVTRTVNSTPHASYPSTTQVNGNTLTVTEAIYPQPQRIFSIGINAGLIIDLKK